LLTGPLILWVRGHLTETLFYSVCASPNALRASPGLFGAAGINVLMPALGCVYSVITEANLLFK